MNYQNLAKKLVECAGSKENLVSAAHCATRLRLVIADNSKVNKSKLEDLEGVKGVFGNAGQLQIILGTGVVNKVYEEFLKETGLESASKSDVSQAATSKLPWYKQAIKALGDIFVPIIPAIVASGLIMGLLGGLGSIFPEMMNNDTIKILNLFSNAAFVFLPILIAFSAAQTFGANPYLGAVIGMIMIHTDLMNAWAVASAESIPMVDAWFGLYQIPFVGYQGHVIPVVIAIYFLSFIQKKLEKVVPNVLSLFVTPLASVLITGYLTLTVFGPMFVYLENGVLDFMSGLIQIPFGIGAALCGVFYAPTVVGGIHHMYNALEAGMISATGFNTWMPIASAANVAQGAAALAFALKTKNQNHKSLAMPASFSAFLGITEPAIFGVNLRFMKPFIAGCIGGSAGSLVAGMLSVSATAYGITGLFGVLITTHNILAYLLVLGVAFIVAFGMTLILYKDKEVTNSTVETISSTLESGKFVIASPLDGEIIPLNKVNDQTFSSGCMGDGFAIIPQNDIVLAPADGTISVVVDTKHAVGLLTDNGMDLLIHIGMNTVKLDGEGFETFVKQGDVVKKGDKLIKFDLNVLKKHQLDTVTSFVITNSSDYKNLEMIASGRIESLTPAFQVEKE